MPKVREITRGLQFPEGPVAMADGSVVLVEIDAPRHPHAARWHHQVSRPAAGPTGGARTGRRDLCMQQRRFRCTSKGTGCPRPRQASDYAGGRIQRSTSPPARSRCCTAPRQIPLKARTTSCSTRMAASISPTSARARARDRDRGGVYYARADGSKIRDRLPVGDAERHRSVAGRQDAVRRRDRGRRGSGLVITGPACRQAAGRRPWRPILAGMGGLPAVRFAGGGGDGNVCVATLVNGGITRDLARGRRVEHDPMPDPLTTNICFGGPDLRTAYITLSGPANWWRWTGHDRAWRSTT